MAAGFGLYDPKTNLQVPALPPKAASMVCAREPRVPGKGSHGYAPFAVNLGAFPTYRDIILRGEAPNDWPHVRGFPTYEERPRVTPRVTH